ncbi:MAG: hypothetical protein N4A41_03765 [Crocinitomicaceae bacterium]|nr:hypothetical protein [Crocinitomicaceae bacterium]
MDYDIELRFQKLKGKLEEQFGEDMDVQAILFLIGVDALGAGYRKFNKQEKTDLLHVAVCTLLEPAGYYELEKRDEDGWPHFKLIKPLPNLNDREQQHLIKEAMLDFFTANGIYEEENLN